MKSQGIRITGPDGAPYELGQPMLMSAGRLLLGRLDPVRLRNRGTEVHLERFVPTPVMQADPRNVGAWLFYEVCAHLVRFHPQVQLISFESSRAMPSLGDPALQAAARVAALERIGAIGILVKPLQSGEILVSGAWVYNERNLRELDAALEEHRAIYRDAPIGGSAEGPHWLQRLRRITFMGACFLAIALATPADAQPTGQVDSTECKAEEAAIERDMDLARSKGQMLRRRQLAEALAALQARCETRTPEQSRAANIDRLEREIRELRKELEQAEEQLRKLKSEAL